MKLARKYLIRGVVQGVGFRYFTYRLARQFDITGSVRNLSDGRVEVVAEGEETHLKRFLTQLGIGPRLAVVEEIITQDLPTSGAATFSIE